MPVFVHLAYIFGNCLYTIFKWIVGMNLFLTLIIWFRTLFLLPIGAVQAGKNVYYASPFYCWFKRGSYQEQRITSDLKGSSDVDPEYSFKKAATSSTFILLCIWMAIANLNLTFCVFTWAQFTRYVDITRYKARLIDNTV